MFRKTFSPEVTNGSLYAKSYLGYRCVSVALSSFLVFLVSFF